MSTPVQPQLASVGTTGTHKLVPHLIVCIFHLPFQLVVWKLNEVACQHRPSANAHALHRLQGFRATVILHFNRSALVLVKHPNLHRNIHWLVS